MGWTNSVPIFYDDVTFILQDEISHVTKPYIKDVPVGEDGTVTYEVISENPGIRHSYGNTFGRYH